ncbi:MAG: hypothetical protein JWM56_35 [Candidatus Peribacteria bacterium]|nr:hypothetical protein [Candidatus Peribacteria bacterium]
MSAQRLSILSISLLLFTACSSSNTVPTASTTEPAVKTVAKNTPQQIQDCGKAEYGGSPSSLTAKDNQAIACLSEAFKSCTPAVLEYKQYHPMSYKVLGAKDGDCLLSLHLPEETRSQPRYQNKPADQTCAISQSKIDKLVHDSNFASLSQKGQDFTLFFLIATALEFPGSSTQSSSQFDCRPV